MAEAGAARSVLADRLAVVQSRAAAVRAATADGPSTHGLDALGSALATMGLQERFVAEVAAALRAADGYGGSGVVSLDSAGIERQLAAVGLLQRPGPVGVAEAELFGLVPTSGWSEDPICTSTGNFVQVESDLPVVGVAGPLSVVRTYNSRSRRRGWFGWGWSHTLDMTLDLSVEGRASVSLADGAVVVFTADSNGGFGVNNRRGLRLDRARTDGAWTLSSFDGERWWFDPAGVLTGFATGSATVRVTRSPRPSDQVATPDGSRDAAVAASGDPTGHGHGATAGPADQAGHRGSVTLEEASSGRWVRFRVAGGVVVETTASDGRSVVYSYDAGSHLLGTDGPLGSRRYRVVEGRVESIVDADGLWLFRNTYDRFGRVTAQVMPPGRRVVFDYSTIGVTRVVGDDDRVLNVFVHDRRGRLTAMFDGSGHALRYDYDDRDRPVRVVDRCNRETRYRYDDEGRPVERVDPDGLTAGWVWEDANRLVEERSRSGRIIRFGYDEGQLAPGVMWSPAGHRSTATRNPQGLPVELVDPDGVRTTITYNPDGLPISVTEGGLAVTRFGYTPAGFLSEIVDPADRHTRITVDAAGRVEAIESPEGIERFRYTPAGRLVGGTTVDGGDWTAEYGPGGECVELTDPAGTGRARFTYDRHGRVITATTDDGATVHTSYDPLGRVASTTDPAGQTTTYTYDPEGRPVTVTDPAGRMVTVDYDQVGQPVTITGPTGYRIQRRYHPDGELATHTGPDGATWRFEINPDGLKTTVTDPAGARSHYRYTPGGRLIETVSRQGRSHTGTYDPVGRLASYTGPNGPTTITRRPDGQPLSITSPRETVAFSYDSLGRPVTVTSTGYTAATSSPNPATGPAAFATSGRAPTPVSTMLSWSRSGHLTAVADPAAQPAVFTHDLNGLLTSVVDPAGQSTEFRYDPRGRLVAEVTGAVGRVFDHDLAGLVTTVTDIDGHRTRIDRDSTGGVTRVERDGYPGLSLERDPLGLPVRAVNDTGTIDLAYRYNPSGLLTAIEAGPDTLTVTRDVLGRPTTITDNRTAAHYQWDLDGRLTTRRIGNHTVNLVRDPNGDIAAFELPDGTTVPAPDPVNQPGIVRDPGSRILRHAGCGYRYDRAGRLAHTTTPTGEEIAYTYGPDGLLAAEHGPAGVVRYHWDHRGRLLARHDPDGTVTNHAYDTAGRRTWTRTPEGETRYLWDDLDRLAAIRTTTPDGTTTTIRVAYNPAGHITAIDDTPIDHDPLTGRIARIGDQHYLHHRGLTHHIGDPTNTWDRMVSDTDPWTHQQPPGRGGGRPQPALGYRGHLTINGLVFMGARVYDPASRSFLTPDPLPPLPGAPAYTSTHLYAWNDPVNYVDPTGLRPLSDADYAATRTDIEGGWLQRNWVDTLGWIAVGALTAVGIALIALTAPAWAAAATVVGAGILIGGALTLGSQLLAGNEIEPWQIAWGQAIGGLSAAAFVTVAPAAGAGWTIGSRATVSGTAYAGSAIGDFGSQLIHNAVTDGPDQDISIWRSLAVGAIAAGTTFAGTYLGPRLTQWWQGRRTPSSSVPEFIDEGAHRLVGANRAQIDPAKFTEYALNPTHPVGRNKARVFQSVLGFTRSNVDELIAQLRAGVMNNNPTAGNIDKWGARFTIDIPVTGPTGSGIVRTGWIYDPGSAVPRLTTLYVL